MDYIGATPMQSPIMGLLADRLKKAQEFAVRPFGYQNPPAEAILNLLGIPAVQQTMERMAYGEPLTTGRGMTTQIRPEAIEAAMTVAPVAGLLGKGAETAAMAAGRAGERYAERVVPQIMERGGKGAQLLQDLGQGSVSPLDVWHGSPHGPFQKFDSSKIGTGEGAQAYGHGLYFGEARGTGEEYRKMLSTKVDVNGKPLYDANKIVGSTGNPDLDDYLVANLGDVAAAKKNLIDDIKFVAEGNPEAAKQMQKTLDDLNNLKVDKQEAGYLYKVDLPDEAVAKMLDWDKPVSKQPTVMTALRSEAEQRVRDRKLGEIENEIRASLPKQEVPSDYMAMFSDANAVQNQEIQAKALSKLNKMDLKELVDKELDSMKPADMNWNMTGKEFYELLARRSGGTPKASEIMQKQGVTGIRYLDQGSRAPGGSDTSNFVVFPGNEDLLRILEINDKPVGGLLGASEPKAFDVTRRDASDIFGAGAERVKYTDPKSGGIMEVLAKPDGSASVISLEVPETSRGKGVGQSLQAQVMQDFPEMMGQVSSKAAAKTAYRLGRRPPGQPNATLDDVYKIMEENSSVNLVSPEMQKRFLGLLE